MDRRTLNKTIRDLGMAVLAAAALSLGEALEALPDDIAPQLVAFAPVVTLLLYRISRWAKEERIPESTKRKAVTGLPIKRDKNNEIV